MAALYVVLHHDWMDTWGPFSPTPQPGRIVGSLLGWLQYGHAAVTVFIAISGFCLTLPLTRRPGSWQSFFKRRAIRILLPYYAALAIGTLSAWLVGWPVSWRGIVVHLFLFHNLTSHIFDLNSPLWSIATECQIYLLFPLLVWLYRRMDLPGLLIGSGALAYLVAYRYEYWRGVERNPHYVFVFALGMAAAILVSRESRWMESRRLLSLITGLSFVGMIVAYRQLGLFANVQYMDIFTGLFAFSVLILCSRYENHPLARLLSTRPMLRIGAFSYSLYLIHQPLQAQFTRLVVTPLGWQRSAAFGLRMAFVPVILAIAFGFYRIIEKPLQKRSKRGFSAAHAKPKEEYALAS